MELVVKTPAAPLHAAADRLDPAVSTVRDWAAEERPAVEGAVAARGCRFADRCPVAMAQCLDNAPPLFRTDARRAAACFRQSAWPVLPAKSIGEVLASKERPDAPMILASSVLT